MNLAKLAGNVWKWIGMTRNCCKWLETVGNSLNGWSWLTAKNGWNSWKCLEMARYGWKWLNFLKMADNGLKLLEMAVKG